VYATEYVDKEVMVTVLVIDDSAPIALMLREMLELLGHRTLIAENGEEGLSLMRGASPDLILLDIMMPLMNGWTFYEEVRQFSTIPVLFITASDTAENRAKAARLGETLLRKEVTIQDLRREIEQALQNGVGS
jgi:two-component system, OmpR family, response regulator TrcR